MKVQEVMTREVEVVHPDDTIERAAQRMREGSVAVGWARTLTRLQG